MWLFIDILLLLRLAACMKDAEETEWNRSGYLVKILSESVTREGVRACTGTLISPSLVLTSSKCIDSDESNSIVIYAKGPNYRKRAVGSISMSGDFALLEIHPIKDEMCPRPPAPVRLSRLPINIKLTMAPWQRVNLEDISEQKCRITGFETTSVGNYSSVHNAMQTPVQVVRDGDTVVVDVSSGSPVCWDDIGLPLECMLDNKGWTQLGLLHTVMKNADDENEDVKSDCKDITALIFALFHDDTLPTLLEDHTVELITSSKKCFSRAVMDEELENSTQ
ncbi:hypothetical protein ANCCAN_08185 [Ancylostoma caninum]|uniref:Peptidase S1 domain-containing protein n=1 Tax=Ancylostoma caninum TaxID=29170 RepID=A0A368GN45_ANCCA|nr:hypothetical protein ANCCAN_08185 [Ancylostoma caninum]